MSPPPDLLQRYLSVRRPVEVAAWLLVGCVQAALNTATVWIDVQRLGLHVQWWEVAAWEWSSNLVIVALLPLVIAIEQRFPLRYGLLRRHGPAHLAGSVLFSGLHVLLMVALREAVYALQGQDYRFGPWGRELLYEYLKDLRTYVLLLGVVLGYRLLLWRLQGEASLLDAPDDEPPPAAPAAAAGAPAATLPPAPAAATAAPEPPAGPDRPERFLVRKLGKEFLLPTAEVEWLQACGNYVNLHRRGHDYPLRSTLAAIEARLDPAQFVRVHRGWIVNLAHIESIEPTEAGDARIRLRDGSTVPCSRRYREALRGQAGAAA